MLKQVPSTMFFLSFASGLECGGHLAGPTSLSCVNHSFPTLWSSFGFRSLAGFVLLESRKILALRTAKRTCHAQHVFANSTDGEEHCEVHHEVCNCDDVEAEIISVSTFVATPFTILDAGQKLSCFIDPDACFFTGLRGFVET